MVVRNQTKPLIPIHIRFAKKVYLDLQSGCWEWRGAKNENNYGVLGIGRRREGLIKAHRCSYQIFRFVELVKDELVCHKCDNPSCVNPKHLFIGSNKDNVHDMMKKGRNSLPPIHNGKANKQAKIDENKVRELFYLNAQGLSSRKIASKLGISKTTVLNVLNGNIWKHVNMSNSSGGAS